jgi:hypothetical protein
MRFTGLLRGAARKLENVPKNSIFREAGLPGEFHAAAEMIYRRMAGFKDAPSTPALEEVLAKLIQTSD